MGRTRRIPGEDEAVPGGTPPPSSEIDRAIGRLNDLRDFLLRQHPDSPMRKRIEALITLQRACLAMLLKTSKSQESAS